METSSVPQLLEAMRNVDKTKLSLTERLEVANACRDLQLEVERPWDSILRIVWLQPSIQACLRTLVDLRLFERWVFAGDDSKTPHQLGELVGCDPDLMERLVRNLASNSLLSNSEPHQYEMTEFTRSLADRSQHSAIRYLYDVNIPVFEAMPAHTAEEGYKNPVGKPSTQSAFTRAKELDGTFFDWLQRNPGPEKDFGECMRGYSSTNDPWFETFPIENLLHDGKDIVVVDVGGNIGHDILAFQKKYNLAPGRLVLQDRPEVIANTIVDSSIKAMAHDIMTPQPVKNARIYYLHIVLHDFPDSAARQILANLVPAMQRGKSRILVHEMVMWPQGNNSTATASDILMMAIFNGTERSIDQFRALIEPVGLKIAQVYRSPTTPQSILELELA